MDEDGEESRMNVSEREREKKNVREADAMRVKIRDEEGS